MYKNLLITILGLGVILGIGFLVLNKNKQATDKVEVETPVEVPSRPVESPTDNKAAFGKPITLHLNEKVTFNDGLKVILTQINDSRCPKDVQCFWAGEISIILEVSGGKLSLPGEVHLGTALNKTANPEDYTFTIKDATTTSATIVVEYKKL